MKRLFLTATLAVGLSGCSFGDSDRDGDGEISRSEREAEINADGFVPMKPGLWESKLVIKDIELPGIAASKKQEIIDEVAKKGTSRNCLSEEQAKKPGADFFSGGGEDCKYEKFDLAGQNAAMKLSCSMGAMGDVEMELDGALGVEEYNFDAALKIRLPVVGAVKMTGNVESRHVGACK